MTFSGGGPGQYQQGHQQQGGVAPQPQQTQQQGLAPYRQQPARGGTGLPVSISTLVALGVTLLSLIEFFMSFAVDDSSVKSGTLVTWSLQLLVLGGLLAALHAVPRMLKVLPFATLASTFGALFYILGVVYLSGDTPGITIAVLILAILQMIVAIAALLLEYQIIPIPTGQPQYPYGYPQAQSSYGQAGGGFHQQYSQQAGTGAPPGQPMGQAGQPVQAPQQPTQYASQQGQFFTTQSPQSQGGSQEPNSGQ